MPDNKPRTIADVFEKRIDRAIEEVIKVDALDDDRVLSEIEEYYPTPSIQTQMSEVLDAYASVHRAKTSDVGVWISGFFGAGKSSFAKLLGILLESRKIGDQDAIELFSRRISLDEIKVLLRQIRENLPTRVVVFDILKDHIAGATEHPVTEVIYRALLRSFGYAFHSLDLAELEINLEQSGQLQEFVDAFPQIYPDRGWDEDKRLTMVARNKASAVLHHLHPDTYPAPDTWARTHERASITPRQLAERALLVSELRAEGSNVVFVVDEIGQYTARDLKRIGDLQGVVESLGQVGKGKLWLIGTSQEKLEDIVDIYDTDRTELVRLQDRFAYKVFLNPSDIREVASHRVLSKKGAADAYLRELYQQHSARLRHLTALSSTVELPKLEEDSFVQLYPLLPYQVDLLISIVSGLRRQASGPQTMGGANRTIIKLAQQLLIHEKVGVARKPIGTLVTLDSVYDLLTTNIATELHQEIDDIQRTFGSGAQLSVAKALALLQFADTVHTTEQNIAAALHPTVDAESRETEVRAAVEQLVEARKVRRTETGLKIQSAAERTWDQERDQRRATHGDRMRIIKDHMEQIWGQSAQRPQCQRGGWRRFTAALQLGSERLVDGDVTVEMYVVDAGRDVDQQVQQARAATQGDEQLIAWAIELTDDAERAIEERYRSERMLQARATARNPEEEALLRDERRRLQNERQRIDSELRKCLCKGRIFFRGNDRSPSEDATDPKAEARRVLEPAVREIYHRFDEGGVKVASKDVEAILRSENLAGLPACYADLGLVERHNGQTRLVSDRGAAKEMLSYIRQRIEHGQAPSGRELESTFGGPPYGWSFELVQLLVATLLRDGQITLKAQSQQIKDALVPEAQSELTNNIRFRALTVTVRESSLDSRKVLNAAKALERRFGHSVPALTAEAIAKAIRDQLGSELNRVQMAHDLLRNLGLPGESALAQGVAVLREVQTGDEEAVINGFLENVETLEKALPRAQAMEAKLTEQAQEDLRRAKLAVAQVGAALEEELEPQDPALESYAELASHLGKETFYEQLGPIRSATDAVISRFQAVYDEAFRKHQQAYEEALEQLRHTPGWHDLQESDQDELAAPLKGRAEAPPLEEPWREARTILRVLRPQTEAAPSLLTDARRELQRILTPNAVRISVSAAVGGQITSPEELDAALATIREQAEQALSENRPVLFV